MLVKEFKADQLKVKVFDNRASLGETAGHEAAAYIRELLSKQDEAWIVFASAPSQNEFLATLAKEDVDWSRVHALHMDEYVGLSADAPQGFGKFLEDRIWGGIKFASKHLIGPERPAEEAIAEYSDILSKHPIDIVFFGIGENGHLAFNDPHVADFNDPLIIKKVDLDATCRQQQVNDGCFATLADVPEYALTITIPVLFKCRKAFIVVPTANKAWAVRATVEDPISEKVPATILRNHPDATLYIDKDSAKDITVA